MIEIKDFTKKFGERFIYKNVSLSLPSKGVVAIVGESGSGKTTLLNAIAGLDLDYDGTILLDSVNLKSLNEDSRRDYRVHNIGYVFQNFNLLNLDNVETNILVPFESTSNSSKKIKERKVAELLSLLDISRLRKQSVNRLSGGEKQRVAIARAMVNSPRVIICDEPTGALDENNSKQIYDILRKISSKSLILIASHDFEGVKKIADQIIKVKDGAISIENNANLEQLSETNFLENNKKVNKGSLSPDFKIKHSFQKIKAKKYRSLITNGMLSLSLTGIGLSIILSTSVSSKIQEAFSSIISGNQVVMSLKQESQNAFSNAYSAPIKKVNEVKDKYSYFIEGVGATYIVNFESFFQDSNDFYVSSTPYRINLPYYSTRSVNDYKWIGDDEMVMYPYKPDELKNDQIVLGLTYPQMVNLCFELKILRNFSSLGHYIRENGLFVTLALANDDWQYDDEQIFEVKAVTESSKALLYHSNKLWNETVFEEMMRLPSDDDSEHSFPWEMYKLYYLKTYEEPTAFLDSAFYDNDFYDLVFERTNSNYHPSLCLEGQMCEENRVLVYMADKSAINPSHLQYISSLDESIKNYYYISDFGYASYASNLLSGFSKNVFVSCDESKIDQAIDADTQISNESNVQIDLPSDVVQGNFLNGISGGLRFSTKFDKLIDGRKPSNIHEIVVSKGLAQTVDEEGVGIGKYLFIAGENKEYLSEDEQLIKDYQVDKVVIVGIVDEEQNYLYHDPLWTIDFFRDRLGVSSFNLIPKSVVIELDDETDSSSIIARFNQMFHDYNFSSPVNELSKSIESTLSYANAILIGFSILSTLISILLLGTVVLLNVLESKEEIYLFTVVGLRQKEIDSLFIYQSLIQGIIAFLLSSIELIVVDYVISKALGDSLHTSLKYSFNYLPIGVIFLFAIFLPLITSSILVKMLSNKKKK